MSTFEIQLGDGSKYEVDAPNEDMAARGLFSSLVKSMSPGELEAYKIRNRDAFSDYIIAQSAQPREGETQAGYDKRRFGGPISDAASWVKEHPTGAAAATLLQGVPFAGEYTDEALGALAGGNTTDIIRGGREAYQAENPKTSMGLKVAGALAGTAPLIAALPASAGTTASLATRMARAVPAGGVLGAVEGRVSGYGAGTDAKSRAQLSSERGRSGAYLGAALGPAAELLVAGANRLAQPIADYVTTSGPLQRMGLSRPTYELLDRATSADEALLGSGAARIRQAGPGAMIADAGPGTQTLLDTAFQKSGPAAGAGRRAIERRAAAAGADFNRALDNTMGPYQGVAETERAIREGTAGARGGAYDAAYALPIDYSAPGGRTLEALLRRVPQSALNRANMLMQVEGHHSRQIMARIGPDGNVVFERMPDVRQLDYITRGLNDVASSGEFSGALGGTTDVGRAFQNLSRGIRKQLRTLVPEYGTALDTAASAIDARNALRLGEGMLSPSVTRSELADQIRGMSRAELTQAQQGLRAQIDDQLAQVTRALSDPNTDAREAAKGLRILSSRANREKIAMVLGQPRAAALFQRMDQVFPALELRAGVAQNSKTFARQDMDATVKAANNDGIGNAIRAGEPVNVVRRAWQAITGGNATGRQMREDQIYSELVNFLTGIRGGNAQRALQQLRQVAAEGPAGRALAARLARDAGLLTASGVYRGTMALRK